MAHDPDPQTALSDPATAIERAVEVAGDPERLEVLHRAKLLDRGFQDSLQRYSDLASDLLGVPVSLVSLIDRSRQYFSAATGLDLQETPLEASYCKHVVADDQQLVVEDSHQDAILATNDATDELGVRAYLGSPISIEGTTVGALCAIDSEAREWSARDRRVIGDLAAAVTTDLELRAAVAAHQRAARKDDLTGLGNRIALDRALRHALAREESSFFGMLDLNGFKSYNDRFGHPAGDGLLIRLARRLGDAVGPTGQAFRVGGDEFCVIVPDRTALEASRRAMRERHPDLEVSASLGAIELPVEAHDVEGAIGLVDRRLYAEKRSRPGSPDEQVADALELALSEGPHGYDGETSQIVELVERVGKALGQSEDQLARIVIAARLRNLGYLSLPPGSLDASGPLRPDHRSAVRDHPSTGSRIIASAPALADVALIVRSTHERYEGDGYPDGLSGLQIPFGARIISACDAYVAMQSPRPHRPTRDESEASAEMLRCVGTQFDPEVVETLIKALGPEAG